MSHGGGSQRVTWMGSVCQMEKVMCHMKEVVSVSHG